MGKSTAKQKSPKHRVSGAAKRRVRFEIEAEKGSDVYLTGTFNQWNPKKNKLTLKEGRYTTTVLIPKGRHEYKFIVGGVWCIDPNCSEWSPNGLGSLNSVIVVE